MMRKAMVLAGVLLCPVLMRGQVKYMEFMDRAPREFDIRLLHCDRVAVPPTVDGVLDDEAWTNVPAISGFASTDRVSGVGKPVTRPTEVKMAHNGRNLYIAFVCHEPEMDKMRVENGRYDFPDILYDDRVEILLDVGHDHKNLKRLVVNADGVMYDTELSRPVQYAFSYLTGSDNWNAEWRAKARRYDDRWTCEVAIALDRFAEEGVAPGDTWGVNFVRDSRAVFGDLQRFEKLTPGREISALVPVFSMVMGKISDRWIEPVLYADMVFDQPMLEVKKLAFNEAYANYNGSVWRQPQFLGDNPLQTIVRNMLSQELKVRSHVAVSGVGPAAVPHECVTDLAPGETKTLESLIRVRGNGHQVFTLTLTDEATGRVLYRTSYDTRVPPFVEFDLAALYPPHGHKASGDMYLAPVTVPGTMQGAAIALALRNEQGETIATDRLEGLAEYAFTPCFTSLDKAALAAGNYTIDCTLSDASGRVIGRYDQPFSRSAEAPTRELGARYAHFSFGGQTGRSVTVDFPSAEKFVFWESASYIPWWDLGGVGVTYEFMECWGYGNQGCNEPMQDKENRYSKPEIIESSPARVVVLWRYALSDPNYRIIFKEWVNEYYYLYPDRTGVREITLWANSDVNHEILQPQYIMPPGVVPQQMFGDTAAVVMNLQGDREVNLTRKPILSNPSSTGKWDEEIMRIYLAGRKHPFLAWSKNRVFDNQPVNNALIKGDVVRSLGGHWPMRMLNVDVYSVTDVNNTYHSWLGALQATVDKTKTPNRWAHLIGLTEGTDGQMLAVAANWLNPPTPVVTAGTFEQFDPVQKAYIISEPGAQGPTIAFDGQVVNPVLIFRGTLPERVSVKINGRPVAAQDYKYAPVTYEYGDACLVWLGRTVEAKDKIKIEFKSRP